MKRVVLLVFVLAIIVSTATVGFASESFWVTKIRAGNLNGTTYDSPVTTVTIGAQPVPPTSQTQNFSSSSANLAVYAGQMQYNVSQWQDSDNPPPYVFTIVLAVGVDYPSGVNGQHDGQVFISAWSPEVYMLEAGRSLPSNYQVDVSQMGQSIATWDYFDLSITRDPYVLQPGPVGFWYTYGSRTSSWSGGDIFTVTVSAVPEPGSLAVLATGLFGLAGAALRRRKA